MIDLTAAPEYTGAGRGILAPGSYRAVIENAEPTTSRAGSPMVKVTFEVEGTKIYEYIFLDAKNPRAYHMGLSKAKSILLAIGAKVLTFRNELDLADALVGELMLELEIKNQEYNGQLQEKNEVKRFFPVPVVPHRTPPRTVKSVRFDTNEIPF